MIIAIKDLDDENEPTLYSKRPSNKFDAKVYDLVLDECKEPINDSIKLGMTLGWIEEL